MRLGDRLVHGPALHGLGAFVITTVSEFHQKNPLVAGISREELRESIGASPEILDATFDLLAKISERALMEHEIVGYLHQKFFAQ